MQPVKTFMEEQEQATLTTLCKGLIPEMFQREFEQALSNVLDPNTPFKKKREVTLKVILTTNEERDAINVEAITSSKLAPFHGESGIVFAAKRGNSVVAVTYNADQIKLPFDDGVRGVVKGDAPVSEPTKQKKAQ